ncbi:MAG: YkgJ family cysteine cluster protein [Cyclobacteriaceae bacterium]
MTGIEQKAVEVEGIFADLQQHISSFSQESGIGCKAACGACCKKPDVEATALEFLPLAISLYKRGLLDSFLEKLDRKTDDPTCILFTQGLKPTQGFCSEYPYRGMICRLFGYSSRLDKYSNPVMVTCRIIKEEFPEEYGRAMDMLRQSPESVPAIRNYSMRLANIDSNLSKTYYPINEAIKLALEAVGWYFDYHSQEDPAA